MAYCEKCDRGFDRGHDEEGPGQCPWCFPGNVGYWFMRTRWIGKFFWYVGLFFLLAGITMTVCENC